MGVLLHVPIDVGESVMLMLCECDIRAVVDNRGEGEALGDGRSGIVSVRLPGTVHDVVMDEIEDNDSDGTTDSDKLAVGSML